MLHVVLVAPEIATNTGNIVRLCANTGSTLHLIEPLGFTLDDRGLKRSGLDYHELVDLRLHTSLESCLDHTAAGAGRRFALSGRGSRRYDAVQYRPDDVLVFGAERTGLDAQQLERFPSDRRLVIPMRPGNRSLNLANAVAVVVYEAWRQRDFEGALPTSDAPGGVLGEAVDSPPFDHG
jgi:tRNA (cytidine/uridine-2'-O-)-methyltransferase